MDTNFLQYGRDNDQVQVDINEKKDHQQINFFPASKTPFQSFWMAGFECADQLNAFGNRVDLLNATGHLKFAGADYKRLSLFGMETVREGIRWSEVEKKPYDYDWSEVAKLIEAGRENNIQQIWDLCHFGFPDDLTPLHPMFARRFASLCRAFVQFFRSIDQASILIITPINEVSFLSWLGGDVRGTSPFCVGQGWEVKYRLMKAYIEGIEALKEADPLVRILTTEPLVNIVPPLNATPEEVLAAAYLHDDQFQVTDILCGKMCPELNGKPEYLDILGYNYYYNNQWAMHSNEVLKWRQEIIDHRFIPLNQLLIHAYQRYDRPLVLTETSHPKEDRPLWINMISEECALALHKGVPLLGVCWYPVIDRPDWDQLGYWHQSGLWDGESQSESIQRILHEPSAKALLKAQKELQVFIHKQELLQQ